MYINVYNYSSWNSTLEKIKMGVYHTGVEIKYNNNNTAISNTVIV